MRTRFFAFLMKLAQRLYLWAAERADLDLNAAVFFPKDTHGFALKHAFTWDGIPEFAFSSLEEMPVGRAELIGTYFEEFEMRITREALLDLVKGIKHALNNNRIADAVELLNLLIDRTGQAVEVMLAFRVAAVYYVNPNESPYMADVDYIEEKARRFAQSDIGAFFLMLPFEAYYGDSLKLDRDFQNYTKASEARIKLMETALLRTYGNEDGRTASGTPLLPGIEKLKRLIPLNGSHSTSGLNYSTGGSTTNSRQKSKHKGRKGKRLRVGYNWKSELEAIGEE